MSDFKKIIKIITFICLIYCNKYILIDILDNYVKNIELSDIYEFVTEYLDIITLIVYLILIYNY